MRWVIAQMFLFLFFVLLPTENNFVVQRWLSIVLVVLAAGGLSIVIRAVYDLRQSLAMKPQPVDNGVLQVHGIYTYIRHPMYLGVWLLLASFAISSGSVIKIFVLLPSIIVFFIIKSRHEEGLLKKHYPEYEKYMSSVGGFLPRR